MLEKTFIFVLGLTLVASSPFYRKDYTYIDQHDAFYKVHWDGHSHLHWLSWDQAVSTCADEESLLFYPKTEDEWTVVKALVAAMKEKPNVTDIIVGIRDKFGEIATVDGSPTPSHIVVEHAPGTTTCVTMDIDTGSYKTSSCEMISVKPFVCKKKVACPTVDTGYIHVKELYKCYKVHQRKKTFDDAQKTCILEGGYLALPREFTRAEVLKQKFRNFEDYFISYEVQTWRQFSDDLYAVKEQAIDEIVKRECGAVSFNNTENGSRSKTKNCDDASSFLCEMNPNL